MRAMILTWGLSVGRDLPEGSDVCRVTRSFIGQRRPERRAVFGVRQRIDARRSSVPQPSLDFAHQCAGDAATPVIGMNRKPVDMAAPLIPPPEDGAHTLTCRLSDEKEATRLLDEQPQPLGRVRDRWSNTGEPPQREYRVTVLGLALTDAEVAHGGGVIPPARLANTSPRFTRQTRQPARGVESCRREAPAHPGCERRAFSSESVASAREWPTSGLRQNPLRDRGSNYSQFHGSRGRVRYWSNTDVCEGREEAAPTPQLWCSERHVLAWNPISE